MAGLQSGVVTIFLKGVPQVAAFDNVSNSIDDNNADYGPQPTGPLVTSPRSEVRYIQENRPIYIKTFIYSKISGYYLPSCT